MTEYIEAVSNVAQTLALIIGGVWAYLHFIWLRERYPRVTMNTDVRILGTQGEGADKQILASVDVRIRNSGLVRLRFRKATLTVLRLAKDQPLQDGSRKILGQPVFDNAGINDRPLFPPAWEYTFVDAGGENIYRSLIRLPLDTTYVLAMVRFTYEDDEASDFHSDIVVVSVKPS
jgi:hypothetical protein